MTRFTTTLAALAVLLTIAAAVAADAQGRAPPKEGVVAFPAQPRTLPPKDHSGRTPQPPGRAPGPAVRRGPCRRWQAGPRARGASS